ncbi:MAG: DUF1275 domain-containing protein [Elusimicrobia bacterium]|nr:DUF1275 domain-containing protein [Elusimicrobiota bacterium]
MFIHKIHDKVDGKTYFDWFVLAFLAGSVNAGGYLACHRFVSHVTGFATIGGVAIEKRDWIEAAGTLAIPLYFLLGAMLSAYFTEKKLAAKVHGERYAPVMWIVAFLLGVVALGGALGYFGSFGGPPNIKHNFILLACLCGACGLQNAAITSGSGATIRTTHMTGLTTDLGLGLIRAEIHHLSEEHRREERLANALRFGTIFFFICGSVCAAFVFARWQYRGFCLPMLIALYAAWVARRSEAKLIAAILPGKS